MDTVRKPHISVDYRGSMAVHGRQVPQRIVLHSTESYDAPGTRDIVGIFEFWRRQGRGFGAHYVVDAGGYVGQGASPAEIAWHVRGHNTGSVGIEQIGFARFARLRWLGRRAQLDKVAKLIAWMSTEYDIPIVHDTRRGVCLHRDFPDSGHTDPGPWYPLSSVLWRARWYRRRGW